MNRDLPAGWDGMSIGELWHRLNDCERRGIAASTLAAAEYLIRENDPKRFEAWLLRHSEADRAAIAEHINKRCRS